MLELGGAGREQHLWLLLARALGIYWGLTGFGFWIPRFVAQALPAAANSPALAHCRSAIPYDLAVLAMVLMPLAVALLLASAPLEASVVSSRPT